MVAGPWPALARSRVVSRILAAGNGFLHGDDPDAEALRVSVRADRFDLHQAQTRNALGRNPLPPIPGAIRGRGDSCCPTRSRIVQRSIVRPRPGLVSTRNL